MELPESKIQAPHGPTDAVLVANIHRDPESECQCEDSDDASKGPRAKKPLAFHLSFTALIIMAFICALDATVLGVAIPVSSNDAPAEHNLFFLFATDIC